MQNARSPSSESPGVTLHIEAKTRQLIDEAAAIVGKSRAEFMVESARRQAVEVLLEKRPFSLNSGRYDALVRALEYPPAPGPKLMSLLSRVPAWRE
jgi:uncharacterized protein (DUF1778 family)